MKSVMPALKWGETMGKDYESNGSRVLVTVGDPYLFTSLELGNGEDIRHDSMLVGGPLIKIKHEALQFFILHYGSSPLRNLIGETMAYPVMSKLVIFV